MELVLPRLFLVSRIAPFNTIIQSDLSQAGRPMLRPRNCDGGNR